MTDSASPAEERQLTLRGHGGIVDLCRQHIVGLSADLLTIKTREATSTQRDAAADRAYAHLRGIDDILTAALASVTDDERLDVERLAEALHDAMCDISHHDRRPARCSKWPKYPFIARSVVPRYERLRR